MQELTDWQQQLIIMLDNLTVEERLEILHKFCWHCGDYTPEDYCQCWNDE